MVIVLSLALSADVFFYSAACGMAKIKLKSFPLLTPLISSALILLTYRFHIALPDHISSLISGAILTLIGLSTLRNPSNFDTQEINFLKALSLSTALSIDDCCLGFFIETDLFITVYIIAVIKTILIFLGYNLGTQLQISSTKTTRITGLFLILLGAINLI